MPDNNDQAAALLKEQLTHALDMLRSDLKAARREQEHDRDLSCRRLSALEAQGQISPEERERLEALLLAKEEKPEAAAPQEVADLAAQVEALQKELEALRARSAGTGEG